MLEFSLSWDELSLHNYAKFSELLDLRYAMMMEKLLKIISGQKFIVTGKGYMGIAPHEVVEGDIISVIPGVRAPMVLRSVENGYIIVGTCFVLDMMDGEMIKEMREGKLKMQSIELV